jgi:hypothetical protein
VIRAFLAMAVALASAGSAAQTLYRCTGTDGRVTYQDIPCATDRGQKRIEVARPESRDEVEGRMLLEREADHGSDLAGRLAGDARSREIERMRELEARAREERLRRQREAEKRTVEETPWETPWGFPAKPGQARPQPKPAS